MDDLACEHYWAPNGSYYCIHCGMDISKKPDLYAMQDRSESRNQIGV